MLLNKFVYFTCLRETNNKNSIRPAEILLKSKKRALIDVIGYLKTHVTVVENPVSQIFYLINKILIF